MSQLFSNRKFVIVILAFVTLVSVVWSPSSVSGQSVCNGNADCTLFGQICQFRHGPVKICSDLSLFADNPKSTASSVGFDVDTNDSGFSLQQCLGPLSICGSPATKPAYWSLVGSGSLLYQTNITGLRSSRTYTASYEGTVGSLTATTSASGITWPGYQTAATVSNITTNSATVNWTTVFDGSTEVYYSVNPPKWEKEHYFAIGDDFYKDFSFDNSGVGWVATYGPGGDGKLYKRSPPGALTLEYSMPAGSSHFIAVDAFDKNNGWAVGENAFIVRKQNGGPWTKTPAPSGFGNALYDVYAATSNTAWAVGDNQRIMFFDGTNWVMKYSTGVSGQRFIAVRTIDNKVVLAVGSGGFLARSVDGGNNWTPTAPFSGVNVRTLSTLDGQTWWAGGDGGRLWRSTDAGLNWIPPINLQSTTDNINSVVQISPDEVWVATNRTVYHLTNATASSPAISNDLQVLRGTVNGDIEGLAASHGAELLGFSSYQFASFSMCHPAAATLSPPLPPTTCSTSQSTPGNRQNHSQPLTLTPSPTPYYFTALSTGSGVISATSGQFSIAPPDTIPPTIAFTNPNPAAPNPDYTNQATYPVAGVASDTAPGTVQSVSLKNNGSPVAGVTGTTTWSANTPLVAGNNLLEATATDGGSNTATAQLMLIRDNQAPIVTIAAPADTSVVNSSPTISNGTASDPGGSIRTPMQYSLNGGPRQNISVTAGSNVNWTTSLPNLNVGPNPANTLTVYAQDEAGNEGFKTITFGYIEPTFTVDIAPSAPQTRNAGDSVVYTVTLTSVNGFTGVVSLAASGIPGSSTTNFSPATVNLGAGGTSTFTLATTPTSPSGVYTIRVTGTSGTKTAYKEVQLTLQAAPDFTIFATTGDTRTIIAGNPTNYDIAVNANTTFSGTVTLLEPVPGLAAATGATGGYTQKVINLVPNQTVNLKLNITTLNTTPDGTYTLTVSGTSGSITHTIPLTLIINPAPDLVLNVSPPEQTITAGDPPISYAGTAEAIFGFTENTTLSVSKLPNDPNLTVTISQTQITQSMWVNNKIQPFSVDVSSTSAVPQGDYTITVTAVSATKNKTFDVILHVGADTTPPVITNIVATPGWNSVRITWDTNNEQSNSQIIIYDDPAQTNIVATVYDAAYVTSHNLYYGPPSPPPATQTPALNSSTTYYFSVTSVDRAPVPAASGICPTAGNCASVFQQSGAPLEFTTKPEPDDIIPEVFLLTPADGSTLSGTVAITGRAMDNKSINSPTGIFLTITGGANSPLTRKLACSGPSNDPNQCTFTFSWNTALDTNGTYVIQVQSEDTSNNLSLPASRTVTVINDPIPQVTCGPAPVPNSLICSGNTCEIIIQWCTDYASTSWINYGLTPSYTDIQSCDLNESPNATPADTSKCLPSHINHKVKLTNLIRNTTYHYQITSCNATGCTN